MFDPRFGVPGWTLAKAQATALGSRQPQLQTRTSPSVSDISAKHSGKTDLAEAHQPNP